MNSIEISMAPHRFDEMKVTEQDNDGRPTRVDYYWKGLIVFHIVMTWDASGWMTYKKVFDDKKKNG